MSRCFDDFLGVALSGPYQTSTVGGGEVRLSSNPSIGGWLELGTSHTQSSVANFSSITSADAPVDADLASVGQQRVVINTATDFDFSIGFISQANPSAIGGILTYSALQQQWFFRTGSGSQTSSVAITGWTHTPGRVFDVRIESSASSAAAFVDGVEIARLNSNLPSSPLQSWDVRLSNQQMDSGHSSPNVYLDYLWVEHAASGAPPFDLPVDRVVWDDQFSDRTIAPQYWISRAGSGAIRASDFSGWMDITASAATKGTARLRLGEDPAVSPHDAMNWYAGLNVVGEQRVVVNTTENTDLTIGWVSRDDPFNVGGALLYQSAIQQWFFQTRSGNLSNNVLTGWIHTPGVAFTVRIETGDEYAAAFINGVEVARSTLQVPSDLPYAWENQLWSYPEAGYSGPNPHMWVDYIRVEQDRGQHVEINQPLSTDGWITGSRFDRGLTRPLDDDWRLSATGDFNGDGTADLLFRHAQTNNTMSWVLTNGQFGSQVSVIDALNPVWEILGSGNFNGSGADEVLLRSSQSGSLVHWRMESGDYASQTVIMRNLNPIWVVQGTGDFNGDGQTDIVLRSEQSGTIVTWAMNEGRYAGQTVYLKNAPRDWAIEGIGDFNGDGADDLLLRYEVTGTVVTWSTNSATFGGQEVVAPNLSLDWQLDGIGDFNGDGVDDLFYRNSSSGELRLLTMDAGGTAGQHSLASDGSSLDWQVMAVGDVNGDGGADLMWRNQEYDQILPWNFSNAALGLAADAWFFL